MAGIRLDDETIRRHCHRATVRLGRRREVAAAEVEYLADGVFAPGRDGWREVKMAMF